ncbi:PKD domain-containing protein [Actinophytocola sp.]|uniref:PKD domain-containing protein n=1 Tax=Actinophytocola sp. TaxID=1872138 RepID=UPI002D7F3C8C|nr:PKD domain-containing protein [Actinophytocola sp.]HET9137954.1 PKD domain-containing protein [Actinophytocola sp.]
MPTEQGPRSWQVSYVFLGLAGVVIATVFAVVASLTNRPVNHVQPLPDMPGPVIADDTSPERAAPPSSIAAVQPTTASQTITKTQPKPSPKPKPSTTQAALPPQPTPPPGQQNPLARFTVSCSGRSCTFDGTGSSDPDGSIVYYAWGFGDGSDDNFQNRARVSHRFPSPGTYAVTLVVLDNAGSAGQVSRAVTVR